MADGPYGLASGHRHETRRDGGDDVTGPRSRSAHELLHACAPLAGMDAGIDLAGDHMTTEQGAALEPGQPAPDFEAVDADGTSWQLSNLRGRSVVLYFYPEDDTPGCTAEACDFRDAHSSFVDENYVVLGVSPQGAASHQRFAAKHRLNFPLLVDADLTIAQRYGAVQKPWQRAPACASCGPP